MPKLTKRTLDAAKIDPSRDYFIWCSATRGFGARVYPTGNINFITQVRVGRAQRRVKIGAFGPFTVEQARTVAEGIIRAAAEGKDPQRERRESRIAPTVTELLDLYMSAAKAGRVLTRFGRPKAQSTIACDAGRLQRHVKPIMGALIAKDVTSADLQRMAGPIAGGRTAFTGASGRPRGKAVVTGGAIAAARVIELLGGIWTWGARRGLVPTLSPIKGVEKTKSPPRDRTLSSDELTALGAAIRSAEVNSPMAAAACRLIALTGARRQEMVRLQWEEIDLEGSCIHLTATKTGRSTRPLGAPVVNLLLNYRRLRPTGPYVFPSRAGDAPADLKKSIAAIFDSAGLRDARSHDLRRTFATVADRLGYSEASIGEILGHSKRSVTGRYYIRRPDTALIAMASSISEQIASALDGKSGAVVVFDRVEIA